MQNPELYQYVKSEFPTRVNREFSSVNSERSSQNKELKCAPPDSEAASGEQYCSIHHLSLHYQGVFGAQVH